MITLLGEPRSTNHIWKHSCNRGFMHSYMTPEGKALKESYQWQAKAQWKQGILAGNVRVSITLYFGTKRKADIDNHHKISLDALTGIVWEDDTQIQEMHVRKEYDKSNPRIELEITLLLV